MLWKHEPQVPNSSSPKLPQVFLQLDRNTENMISISFRKHREEKNENNL